MLSCGYNSTSHCGSKVEMNLCKNTLNFVVISVPFTSGLGKGVENELENFLTPKNVFLPKKSKIT